MSAAPYREIPSFVSVPSAGEVEAIVVHPEPATAMLAFAHGAGAGISHPFMQACAVGLARHGIGTLRYQFPYMERRAAGERRPPDRAPVLIATVRAAVARARALAPGVPVLAGGKSMGGRMTSLAAAEEPLRDVAGIVFFGFPLHPAGRPSIDRAAHLADVALPMLFLQGTRDALAELALLRPILADLGPKATLKELDGADHSFHVLKRSGRTDDDVLAELGESVAAWVAGLSGPARPAAAPG